MKETDPVRRISKLLFFAVLSLPAQERPASPRPASVTGLVYDSLAHAPLAGAEVQFVRDGAAGERQSYVATADVHGRFAIANIEPGNYSAGFFHARLDTLGVGAPLVHVVVRAQQSSELILAIPSLRSIAALLCGKATASESSTLLAGYVRDAGTRAPRPGATVSVQWPEIAIGSRGLYDTQRGGVVQVGADGRFAACNAPPDAELVVRAAEGTDSSGVVILHFSADRVVARDLFIGPSEPAPGDSLAMVGGAGRASSVPRRGPARLDGTIHGASGEPLGSARVFVWGTNVETVTGEDGGFHLVGLPAGSYTLDARAVGYEPSRSPVDLLTGDVTTNTTAVVLKRRTPTLDTVRVMERPSDVLARSGFTDRRRIGFGHFLDRAFLDKRNPLAVKDALRDIPAVDVRPRLIKGGPTVVLRTFSGFCMPDVYVDGQQFSGEDAQDILSTLDPGRVVGIEVYTRAAVAPLQFGGTKRDGCGSILIWNDVSPRRGPKKSP